MKKSLLIAAFFFASAGDVVALTCEPPIGDDTFDWRTPYSNVTPRADFSNFGAIGKFNNQHSMVMGSTKNLMQVTIDQSLRSTIISGGEPGTTGCDDLVKFRYFQKGAAFPKSSENTGDANSHPIIAPIYYNPSWPVDWKNIYGNVTTDSKRQAQFDNPYVQVVDGQQFHGKIYGQMMGVGGDRDSYVESVGWVDDKKNGYGYEEALGAAMQSLANQSGEPGWVSGVRYIKVNPWTSTDFDTEGKFERAQQRADHAAVEYNLKAFEGVGMTILGVAGYSYERFSDAAQGDVVGLFESAANIDRELEPTLSRLSDILAEMKKATTRKRSAQAEANYYTAPIGSDERPSNLSYERAEAGYRYERQLSHDIFHDESTGITSSTERFQTPAEESTKQLETIAKTG